MRFEALFIGRVALRIGAFASSVGTVTVGDGSAEVLLAAGRIDTCVAATVGRLRLAPCASLASGPVIARGQGFETSHDAVIAWVAAGAGLDVRLQVTDTLALTAGLDGWLSLLRPRLRVEDSDGHALLASRSFSPVGGAVAIGIAVSIP